MTDAEKNYLLAAFAKLEAANSANRSQRVAMPLHDAMDFVEAALNGVRVEHKKKKLR